MKGWHSLAAWVYYTLGASYYIYHWYLIIGLSGLTFLTLLSTDTLAFQFLLLTSTIFIIFGVWSWMVRTERKLAAVNPLWDITKSESTYEQVDEKNYKFTQEISLRAREHGAQIYAWKFKWTGSGVISFETHPAEVRVESATDPTNGIWEIKTIKLPRPLRKGEVYTFTLFLSLRDDQMSAIPMVNEHVDDLYPNGIVNNVVLPKIPGTIVKEIFFSSRNDLATYRETESDPMRKTFSWRIKRPRIGRRYKLSWTL